MNQYVTIARIYAKAILDLSIEFNNVDQWISILESFSKISQNVLLRSLCFNELNTEKLAKILESIFEDLNKIKLTSFGRNFIYIVVKNKRVLLLPKIFEEFNNLYNFYMKSIIIDVISARQLSNNQLKKITEIMTHRLSKKVQIKCSINTNILAGIIIKIKDIIIDGSLVGRISRLHNILQF